MIDVKYNEVKDRNSWIDGNYLNATICVTEDCNLRCTYCYMVGKNNVNRMNWETGKQIIDFLLDNPYTSEMSDSIMLDFIGGEPLLEMDLIDKMCDYFILECIRKIINGFQIMYLHFQQMEFYMEKKM